MIRNPQEVKFGDGGHILPGADSERIGDVLPLEDGFGYVDEEQERDIQSLGENSTQQEKIAYVYDTYRFYPKSPEELSAIVGIDGARNSDAAKYLSIIMQHQESLQVKTVDPTVTERTAKKLAADFIKYRNDSRAVSTFLRDIFDEISEVGSDSDVSSIFRDYDGGQLRALAQVIRREEMSDFSDGEKTDKKYDFLKDSEYLKLLDYYVAENEIGDFIEMIEDSGEEERRRYNYWNEKIRELKRVTTVSAMARKALGEI